MKINKIKLKDLADIVGCDYEGDGDVEITGISSIDQAEDGDIVFYTGGKFKKYLETTRASAIIISDTEEYRKKPVIKSKNPQLTFIRVVEQFYKELMPVHGIHKLSFISKAAKLGKNVSVGQFSVIMENVEIGENSVIFPLCTVYPEVKIGKNCVIHSNVSIRERTEIGNNVIVHNGVVIGSDGFGYLKLEDKTYKKIPQVGKVIIEDDVEIGANTAIDRAAIGETVIRKGTKIDNLVQVGHNVKIGANTIISGQTGIAGSTVIGNNVVTGGQVGIGDHLEIGDNSIIAAKSGVASNLKPDSFVAGYPEMDIKKWRKSYVSLYFLPDLIREFRELKERLEQLEKNKK